MFTIEIQGTTITATSAKEVKELLAMFGETAATGAVNTAKKKPAKGKKQQKSAQKQQPKEQPEEFKYTKSGQIIQNEKHHTLTSGQLRRVHNAIKKLEEQGFQCGWKRRGAWIHLYSTDGKGYTEEFKNAQLTKGWKYWTTKGGRDCGVFIDTTMLKDATDSVRK